MKSGINDVILHLLANHQSTLDMMENDLRQRKAKLKEQIADLNRYLAKEKKALIRVDKQGVVSISDKTRESLYQMLKSSSFIDFNYLSPEIRANLIILRLLTNQGYHSLQELADFVEVSKNTMLHDMKRIKEIANSYSLQVKYSRSEGYRLVGSEYRLRRLLVTEARRLLYEDFSTQLMLQKKMIDKDQLFFLRKRLMNIEKKLKISLTDEQIDQLPVILHLLIKRMKAFPSKWYSEVMEYDIKNTKSYHVVKEMFWDTDLDENDKLYLVLQVLSSNLLEAALDVAQDEELKFVVEDFLDLLEGYLATDLINKTELKNKLILHLRPAIYRTWLSLNVQNPLMEKFIKEYPSIYAIVAKSVDPIEEFIGKKFSKEEIAYIAMHIQAWIYQTKEQKDYAFKALVVCRNGTSVSKLLLESLKGMFNHFEFIGAFAERTYKKYEEEVDFIFSTVPLNTSKKMFLVDPILNEEKRSDLKKQLRKYIDKASDKKARELIYHLKEYIDPKDREKVEQRIRAFFEQSSTEKESSISSREDIFAFQAKHILFTDREMSWEEALEKAFTPMVQRNSITYGYLERVKALFAEDGESMMIGPSLYLPHASPSDGALREDYNILFCRHRVLSPEGKPIKMMIALSPDREGDHVSTLLFFNEIFLDEQKRNKLFTAGTAEEVIAIINSLKGGKVSDGKGLG